MCRSFSKTGSSLRAVRGCEGSSPLASSGLVLRIVSVQPLEGRLVRLTLTDGSVVHRDLGSLLDGVGVFGQISADDTPFRRVRVEGGTLAWPTASTSRPKR
jgi:hypothetical protein